MLIPKRTYKKKYCIGGAGISESIESLFARMLSSNAEKKLALSTLQAEKLRQKILE